MCAVIVNYHCYCEFLFFVRGCEFGVFRVARAVVILFFGWRALLFLIINIIISVVVGWRARLFLIITSITCVCVFGWRTRLLLSTTTSASCVFVSGGVHGFF